MKIKIKLLGLLVVCFALLSILIGCEIKIDHIHSFEEEWSYDEEYHFKKCTDPTCNETYKQGKHNFVEDVCTVCGYDRSEPKVEIYYKVTFVDDDGTVLKEETVLEGQSATAPNVSDKAGLKFSSWDKNFTNVTSDMTVKAVYSEIKEQYSITYDLNGGRWDYNSKTEFVIGFLKAFYEFVNPEESLNKFIYDDNGDLTGSWSEYIGGSVGLVNRLLHNNDLDSDNPNYFFNNPTYKAKWGVLADYVKNDICKENKRFGANDYYYGALDFYRYIVSNPDQYIDFYGGEDVFYGYPNIGISYISTYNSGVETDIITPLSPLFDGWTDQYGNKITKITSDMYYDLELTANWKDKNVYTITFDSNGGSPVEPLEVEVGSTIELEESVKDGYRLLGWYYNDVLFTSNKYFFDFNITLVAKWQDNTIVNLIPLEYDGKAVKYRNSNTTVLIPDFYLQKEEQLRACWISSFAGDWSPSTNKETMMSRLNDVLDVLEYFNMNCIIFHIRTHNQAFYKTKMTYIKSSYGTYESFEEWDYLEWFIGECHKRGIQFHAWLNPYRIVSSGATSLAETAKTWENYPNNPASDVNNMLMNSSGGVILDPAIPEVRNYITDICLEVMEQYDVDAIHFDDYFYISGVDDSTSFNKYKLSNSETIDNFRRRQVDLFIKQLYDAMTAYNLENHRHVQLGISPTGIYRNGNGSVESGSNTSGYAHYGSPLYADTLNWIRHEWIDYILPQSYWAITHASAGYPDVMDWWNKAVAGYKVNLYSGIGLYMNNNNGSNYSWGTQAQEVANQVLYTTKLENCQGVSFYAYSSIVNAYQNSNQMAYAGLKTIHDKYWTTKVAAPKTMADALNGN